MGGTGFIGKNLVNYFSKQEKYLVTATFNKTPFLSNEKVKWVNTDLRDPKKIKNLFQDIDIVIQAAATTSGAKDIIEKPYIHVTDNAVMNSLILREVFHSDVKHFIFFSCTVMYPNSEKKLNEDIGIKKLHKNYFGVGNTKLYIEKMCEFYSNISEKKYTAIRHSNVYGPHDKFDLEKSHIFGASITKVANSFDNNSVEVWGDGKEKRDLLYIDDLIDFVEKTIANQKRNFEVFNCGSEDSVSINHIVKRIIYFMNPKCKINYNKSKPSIKTNLLIDCSKARKEIGWFPKTSLDDGIKKTISWWKKNIKQ